MLNLRVPARSDRNLRFASTAALLGLLCALVLLVAGCGARGQLFEPLGSGGGSTSAGPSGPGGGPSCRVDGFECSGDLDCCSGRCQQGVCGETIECRSDGEVCAGAQDCCSSSYWARLP